MQQTVGQNTNTVTTVYISEIVEIMGGIKHIKEIYSNRNQGSNSTEHCLNRNQITEIHQLTSAQPKYITPVTDSNRQLENINGDDGYKLTFETENTFLNYCFGKTRGSNIDQIIWNKTSIICWIILFIISHSVIALFASALVIFVYRMIFYFFCIPYLFLLIMTMNRTATAKICKSFVFWFKIYYLVMGQTASVINSFFIPITNPYPLKGAQRVCEDIVWSIAIILLVILMSLADARPAVKNWKIAIFACVGVSAFIMFKSIFHQLKTFGENGDDYWMINVSSNITISLQSVMATSWRVVSIFLFKQSIAFIYQRMGKKTHAIFEKAILIKTSPYLEWKYPEQTVSVTDTNREDSVTHAIHLQRRIPDDDDTAGVSQVNHKNIRTLNNGLGTNKRSVSDINGPLDNHDLI